MVATKTTPRRSFKSKNKGKKPPFVIEVDDQQFTCRGAVSGGLLLKLISRFSGFNTAEEEELTEENVSSLNLGEMNDLIRDFFTIAIVRDEQDKFFEFIDDPDQEIELEMLTDIMTWLMGVYSERPLDTSEESTQNT